MAYCDFTTEMLRDRFGVEVAITPNLFTHVPPAAPSHLTRQVIEQKLTLAITVSTEKIRSELLIAPLLTELWTATNGRIGVFSGAEFNVERKKGLSGFCDYLL